MKKRNYLSDVEDRSGNAFSVIADFEGNEEQLMDIEVEEVKHPREQYHISERQYR